MQIRGGQDARRGGRDARPTRGRRRCAPWYRAHRLLAPLPAPPTSPTSSPPAASTATTTHPKREALARIARPGHHRRQREDLAEGARANRAPHHAAGRQGAADARRAPRRGSRAGDEARRVRAVAARPRAPPCCAGSIAWSIATRSATCFRSTSAASIRRASSRMTTACMASRPMARSWSRRAFCSASISRPPSRSSDARFTSSRRPAAQRWELSAPFDRTTKGFTWSEYAYFKTVAKQPQPYQTIWECMNGAPKGGYHPVDELRAGVPVGGWYTIRIHAEAKFRDAEFDLEEVPLPAGQRSERTDPPLAPHRHAGGDRSGEQGGRRFRGHASAKRRAAPRHVGFAGRPPGQARVPRLAGSRPLSAARISERPDRREQPHLDLFSREQIHAAQQGAARALRGGCRARRQLQRADVVRVAAHPRLENRDRRPAQRGLAAGEPSRDFRRAAVSRARRRPTCCSASPRAPGGGRPRRRKWRRSCNSCAPPSSMGRRRKPLFYKGWKRSSARRSFSTARRKATRSAAPRSRRGSPISSGPPCPTRRCKARRR